MSGVDRNFQNMGARIRQLANHVEQETKELIEYYTREIEVEAFRAAPGGGDRIMTENGPIGYEDISNRRRGQTPIAQAIGYIITNNGLSGTIYVEHSAGDVAAYVEFGTGQSAASYLATVPPEWKALAARFIVNRRGTIVEQAYLLPSILRNEPKLIADLKKMMSELRL